MKNKSIENNVKINPVVLPEGKCCSTYCGDCTYFNPRKTSYGKCWCGYYKAYSRTASDLACSNFVRG